MEKLLKRSNLLILVIVLVAAFLRLYRIGDYLTFLGDEGRDALVVYEILHGHFTLLGPTSSVGGFFLGPIYYYFMAPFLWLSHYDPVGPAIMVAIMGTITVFLVYLIGKEFFNAKAALFAAALYAVSPVVIAYSRSSWNPNLMPFFSLTTLYILYQAVKRNKTLLFILSGILLGIAMQLHYIATFLAITIFVYIVLARFVFVKNRSIINIRRVIIDNAYVLIGYIIGWSPFLAFELRHGFTNTRSIFNFIFHSPDVEGGGNYSAIVGDVFFRLFGRLITKFPPPEQLKLHSDINIFLWQTATLLLAIFSVAFLIYLFRKAMYQNETIKLQRLLLLTWFFVGIFLFGFYKKSIYDYYFEFMFPLPFLLAGNSLSFLSSIKRLPLQFLAYAGFVGLIVFNLTGAPFWFEANHQKDQVKLISDFVLSKTDSKPFNFALLTGGNSDHAYRYYFKLAGKDPVMIETLLKDPQRKTVTDQLLIVCEDIACQPLGAASWEVAGFGRADIAKEWDVSVVKVYKLVHYKGK